MIPTIITKTKTVNSRIFDRGFSLKDFRLFSTKNSFITINIFSRWVNEVFLKKVEKKRARLRRMMATSTTRSSSSSTDVLPTRLSRSWRCLHKKGLW